MYRFVPLLVLTVVCVVVAYRLDKERLVIFWLLWSGLIHLLMEVSYGVFAELVTTPTQTTFTEYMLQKTSILSWFDLRWWASIYEQYAQYDGRYALQDDVNRYICYSELVMGPLCFLLVALIVRESKYRHPVQVMLCTMQIYGTLLYFLMPIVDGTWGTVMTTNLFDLIVYVIILNGIWIVVPSLLLVQSARYFGQSTSHPAIETQDHE